VGSFLGERFKAGDYIEQFLVDAALAQLMEGPVKLLEQIVDILIGALHCGQTARVFAGEGVGASPEE